MPAYSSKAQPYLDAIAAGVFASSEVRNWLIDGTPAAATYRDAEVLIDEQRDVRWHAKPTKQPFWANCWCGRDSRCECRVDDSKGLESDAIFFLRNDIGRTLAVHVEFKHPAEPFSHGQAACYPLRAHCFSLTHTTRKTLNAHEDWVTVLFCGTRALTDPSVTHFQKVITHDQAAERFTDYPA